MELQHASTGSEATARQHFGTASSSKGSIWAPSTEREAFPGARHSDSFRGTSAAAAGGATIGKRGGAAGRGRRRGGHLERERFDGYYGGGRPQIDANGNDDQAPAPRRRVPNIARKPRSAVSEATPRELGSRNEPAQPPENVHRPRPRQQRHRGPDTQNAEHIRMLAQANQAVKDAEELFSRLIVSSNPEDRGTPLRLNSKGVPSSDIESDSSIVSQIRPDLLAESDEDDINKESIEVSKAQMTSNLPQSQAYRAQAGTVARSMPSSIGNDTLREHSAEQNTVPSPLSSHAPLHNSDHERGVTIPTPAESSEEERPQRTRADLTEELMQIYQKCLPTPQGLNRRAHIIQRITKALRRRWPKAKLRVEAFGSTATSLDSDQSDLDLCIIDDLETHNLDPSSLPSYYSMFQLADVLRFAGFAEVSPISHANVPICKFVDPMTGTNGDINTMHQLGIQNSLLIRTYVELHPLARPFIYAVKFWARRRGLNDSSGRDGPTTFSSYTLVLMAIQYLQVEKILPNLQDEALLEQMGLAKIPAYMWQRNGNPRRGNLRGMKPPLACDVTFAKNVDGWSASEDRTLESLFRGFFRYYTITFYRKGSIVSIQNGKPLDRARTAERPTRDRAKKESIQDKASEAQSSLFQNIAHLQLLDGTETAKQANGPEIDFRELGDLGEPWEIDARKSFAKKTSRADYEGRPTVSMDAHSPSEDILDGEPDALAEDEAAAEEQKDQSALEGDDLANRESVLTPPDEDPNADSLERSKPMMIDRRTFVQPVEWQRHSLVVQDPFILTRNTAMNITGATVAEIVGEMERARIMLEQRQSIEDVCAPVPRSLVGGVEEQQKRLVHLRAIQQLRGGSSRARGRGRGTGRGRGRGQGRGQKIHDEGGTTLAPETQSVSEGFDLQSQ